MRKRITTADNIYLALPFVIMFLLYWSSSMTYETQSLISPLEHLLKNIPFESFLSQFQFSYGDSIVSVEALGYFSFVEFFIRKGAHFFSYFFLAFFWFLGLRKRVSPEWLIIILSILLSIGYASFDELRQSFNPDRTGSMLDVLLDSTGALTGVVVAYFLSKKRIIK